MGASKKHSEFRSLKRGLSAEEERAQGRLPTRLGASSVCVVIGAERRRWMHTRSTQHTPQAQTKRREKKPRGQPRVLFGICARKHNSADQSFSCSGCQARACACVLVCTSASEHSLRMSTNTATLFVVGDTRGRARAASDATHLPAMRPSDKPLTPHKFQRVSSAGIRLQPIAASTSARVTPTLGAPSDDRQPSSHRRGGRFSLEPPPSHLQDRSLLSKSITNIEFPGPMPSSPEDSPIAPLSARRTSKLGPIKARRATTNSVSFSDEIVGLPVGTGLQALSVQEPEFFNALLQRPEPDLRPSRASALPNTPAAMSRTLPRLHGSMSNARMGQSTAPMDDGSHVGTTEQGHALASGVVGESLFAQRALSSGSMLPRKSSQLHAGEVAFDVLLEGLASRPGPAFSRSVTTAASLSMSKSTPKSVALSPVFLDFDMFICV